VRHKTKRKCHKTRDTELTECVRPSIKSTKPLFIVIKAIVIIRRGTQSEKQKKMSQDEGHRVRPKKKRHMKYFRKTRHVTDEGHGDVTRAYVT